ncbi:MarR family transcriptional regulator [Paenibacillus validus]|nr:MULTISPECIES: MarR family transcriptional regulator [Paenibacillus]MED4604448.1 MarR family transcriptional regulator [Paenibacillus validus]MED4609879.1 MarR family transcriptional regulator [Paenibacillus validus]
MSSENPTLSMGFLIGQTYRKMVGILAARFKEYDITTEQFSVLCRLAEQDGISQKEIAARTVKDQPTTARILDCLIRKGLVHKEMSAADRRSFLVYLTPLGRERLDVLLPLEKATLAEIFAGLDAEELARFRETHLQLHRQLDALHQQQEA